MAESDLIDKEMERIAGSIGIPPCPGILLELAEEAKKEEADFGKVERLVARDVGLSAMLLKTINSPFYGLRTKISSVSQAISMLGLASLSKTITGLVLRNVFSCSDHISMERFWDTSAKFAIATSLISKEVVGLNKDDGYTYGLFQNCGIPVLMQKYPDYKSTLSVANSATARKFTEVEVEAHGTDHATMGYLLTKSWHLPEAISSAVRYHHEYRMISENSSQVSNEVKDLIALGLLADRIVQLNSGMNFSREWDKGGQFALERLFFTEEEFAELCEDIFPMLEQ